MALPRPPQFALQRWPRLTADLEYVLDLPERERTRWLTTLRARDAEAAGDIEYLLESQRALQIEGFLERPYASPMRIGPYQLKSLIGRGGTSSVWLAERSDAPPNERFAIKLSTPSAATSDTHARFQREAAILTALDHPNIARLLDTGVTQDGRPYLVLEHVRGRPIDVHCRVQGLGMQARLLLFLSVLAPLAHAHARGIVHRDLKPSNILVRDDGLVKVLDFGIAKLLHVNLRTAPSSLTPSYAAPEQIGGEATSPATDVYALGVLLYQLLTERHPAGEPSTLLELLHQVLEVRPPRMSRVVRDATRSHQLRGALDLIVATALEKQPRARYASARALSEDLWRYLHHEPIRARRSRLGRKVGSWLGRFRLS